MPDFRNRTIALVLGGLALFALVLIVGANTFLKAVLPEPSPEPVLQPLPDNGGTPAPGGLKREIDGPVHQIIETPPVDTRPVTYTDDGFSPDAVTIRGSDAIGCIISVINRSAEPLRVGVNPHDPTGDPGAAYRIIPPGETGLLDARYPGLDAVELHSHTRPEHGFLVQYGDGCR